MNFGYVADGGIESLLLRMKSVFVPALTSNTSWPDSVKKEVTGQVHRFMASLTETVR